MILSYTFPNFVQDIIEGRKKHTLRRDPARRWKPGMSIQHWLGSPRNNRGKTKPYKFEDGECYSIQEVYIQRMPQLHLIESGLLVQIDGVLIPEGITYTLIHNDCLQLSTFREFFVPESSPVWRGRIIHFTLFEYQVSEPGVQMGFRRDSEFSEPLITQLSLPFAQ